MQCPPSPMNAPNMGDPTAAALEDAAAPTDAVDQEAMKQEEEEDMVMEATKQVYPRFCVFSFCLLLSCIVLGRVCWLCTSVARHTGIAPLKRLPPLPGTHSWACAWRVHVRVLICIRV